MRGFEEATLAEALELTAGHTDEELYLDETLATRLCNAAYEYLHRFGINYLLIALDELETAGEASTYGLEGEDLKRLDGVPILKPDDTEAFAQQVFTQRAVKEFKETGEADFAYGRPDLGRFRVSAFRQRGSISLVLRRVLGEPPSLDSLGLPGVRYRPGGDEHGILEWDGQAPPGLAVGEQVALIPGHIDTTVNLYDTYHVHRGGELVAAWPLAARGKIQ